MAGPIDRNLGFDLVRVTEAAAMSCARWQGRGDKNAADHAAVEAMRFALQVVPMDGIVVIGEGEKDEAPMLYIGERVGSGSPPQVDVAVDPIDGTTLTSKGLPNAVSVVALAARGSMFYAPGIVYMEKIAVGPECKGCIDLDAPVHVNLAAVARAKGLPVNEVTAVVLDRPRHEELIREVRDAGARIKLISDGDVAGAIMTAMEGTGGDVLMGIGGSPEAVIAACALKCLGGEIQCRIYPRNDQERQQAIAAGFDPQKVLRTNDLVGDDDVFFALTGVTSGELVRGVRYTPRGAETESLIMRARSGTVRRIQSSHNFEKLTRYSGLPY
ncbi:MAG: class II fructose-bisphosphatase [Actinobacteria bacterium]|nr:class II fructose-bisphosphatase [Actinomycetota bacterium]